MVCVCDSTSRPLVCVFVILLLQCSICNSGVFQVVGPDEPLSAVPGKDLILPCFLKPSMSAEGMTVEWFRLNQGQESLVHLYKNHMDQNSRQVQSYQHRTTLLKEDLKMGNASLKLSKVQFSDEGKYNCLMQSESHYDDTDVHVLVRGIGQPPRITVDGVRLDGGVSLLCESDSWKFEPVIEWLDSNGRLLAAEPPEMVPSPYGFRVKRRLVTYNSDTDHYACRLTQTHEGTPEERKVEMMAMFHVSDAVFTRPWKTPFIIYVCSFIIMSLMLGLIIYYYRGKRKRKRFWKLLKNTEEAGDFHLEKCPGHRLKKMLPSITQSRRVWLNQCQLSKASCKMLASVLQKSTILTELDLSNSTLEDEGLQMLCGGLRHPQCKLEKLRLSGCLISEKGCGFLASALTSNPSHLKELDLSYNHPGESGLKLLSARLEDPDCKLEILNSDHCGEIRLRPGVQKYACKLTLDPNTASRLLSLSEGNRKVTRVSEWQPYPDHPQRFEGKVQVLCREGLSGHCYWETEWSGDEGVGIDVAYRSIKRKGQDDDTTLGNNAKSWSLWCLKDFSYSAWHNNKHTAIPAPSSGSRRVGVYLDWPAGTLSFYSVSSDTLTLLHTFHSTFTEPLYPGFGFPEGSSVSLCQIT